jgi:hypothetical protein
MPKGRPGRGRPSARRFDVAYLLDVISRVPIGKSNSGILATNGSGSNASGPKHLHRCTSPSSSWMRARATGGGSNDVVFGNDPIDRDDRHS